MSEKTLRYATSGGGQLAAAVAVVLEADPSAIVQPGAVFVSPGSISRWQERGDGAFSGSDINASTNEGWEEVSDDDMGGNPPSPFQDSARRAVLNAAVEARIVDEEAEAWHFEEARLEGLEVGCKQALVDKQLQEQEQLQEQQRQRHRRCCCLIVGLVGVAAVALAAILGVVLGRKAKSSRSMPGKAQLSESVDQPSLNPIPGAPPASFTTGIELHDAVWRYADESQRDGVLLKYGDPIGSWDVSRVSSFHCVFFDDQCAACPSFDDCFDCMRYPIDVDISGWDTSNGADFEEMFLNAVNLIADLSSWDVSKGKIFNAMFYGTSSFDSDLSQWEVSSSGTDFDYMFYGATSFAGAGLPV